MTAQTTLTQQFAAEYAKGAVPKMLKAIKTIKAANKLILLGALAASYLHQAHYLGDLGAGFFAWIVPAVFDLGMVSMLTITQTPGMAADAKRAAMKILVVLVLISATVNFAAPGAYQLRIIFALVVALVAGVEWVAGKIRPDFAAIEARETEVAGAAPAKIGRKLDPETAAARAAKAKTTREANAKAKAARDAAAQERAAKAAATRKAKQTNVQAELDLMLTGYTPTDAPTSPAPVTH